MTFLWFLTAAVMLYIIFGNYPGLDDNFQYSKLYNSLFTGFHRNLWALGLSWIVFACINGYGGKKYIIRVELTHIKYDYVN